MNAVLESVDSGADLSGGDATAAEPTQASSSGQSGAATGAEGAGTAGTPAEGSSTPGAGDSNQSGVPAAGEKDKLVPLAALHESREQVKQLRAKIAELEALPRLTEAQQKLLDKLNAQDQAASTPKDPDFLEDPKGYIDSQAKKTQNALKKLDEENAKRQEQERAQAEFQRVVAGTSAKEQEFLKATPDYYDAVNHMRAVRTAQLQMLSPNATPQQIQAAIAAEEIGAARQILQSGGDPASFAYQYAKTLGYAPKAPAVASAAGATATKADKDAARSLGGGGGAEPTTEEDDNAMPEFAAALAERFGVRKKK